MTKSNQFHNGLPVWSEYAINRRQSIINELSALFKDIWMSGSWGDSRPFIRTETSPLCVDGGVGLVETDISGMKLRNETTAGTYDVAKLVMDSGSKLPFCIWQSGMSFRNEKSDAMRRSKYRYYAFHQLEFQCFYIIPNDGGREDIFPHILKTFPAIIPKFKLVKADAPAYSVETWDYEIDGIEVASLSRRRDFPHRQMGSGKSIEVAEFSFGLDRLIHLL